MADCCIPGSNGGLPLPPMELRHQVYRMLGEHDSEGTLPSRENGRTTISPSADWKGQTDTGGDEHSHKLRMLFRTAAQENFRLTSRDCVGVSDKVEQLTWDACSPDTVANNTVLIVGAGSGLCTQAESGSSLALFNVDDYGEAFIRESLRNNLGRRDVYIIPHVAFPSSVTEGSVFRGQHVLVDLLANAVAKNHELSPRHVALPEDPTAASSIDHAPLGCVRMCKAMSKISNASPATQFHWTTSSRYSTIHCSFVRDLRVDSTSDTMLSLVDETPHLEAGQWDSQLSWFITAVDPRTAKEGDERVSRRDEYASFGESLSLSPNSKGKKRIVKVHLGGKLTELTEGKLRKTLVADWLRAAEESVGPRFQDKGVTYQLYDGWTQIYPLPRDESSTGQAGDEVV